MASTGHYREGFFPEYVGSDSVEELATGMVAEVRRGIGDSGIRDGYLDRVVLSQDIASTTRLHSEGAPAYTAILTELFPQLREVGIDQASLDRLCRRNPWRRLGGDGA